MGSGDVTGLSSSLLDPPSSVDSCLSVKAVPKQKPSVYSGWLLLCAPSSLYLRCRPVTVREMGRDCIDKAIAKPGSHELSQAHRLTQRHRLLLRVVSDKEFELFLCELRRQSVHVRTLSLSNPQSTSRGLDQDFPAWTLCILWVEESLLCGHALCFVYQHSWHLPTMFHQHLPAACDQQKYLQVLARVPWVG